MRLKSKKEKKKNLSLRGYKRMCDKNEFGRNEYFKKMGAKHVLKVELLFS